MAIKNRIQRLKSALGSDEHAREMLLGSIVALVVKVLAAVSAFLMNVIVARKLGASEAGLFHLGVALITVIAAFGRMGLDNTLVRFIAGERASGNDGAVVSIYRQAMLWSALLSAALAVGMAASMSLLTTGLFKQPGFESVLSVLWVAIPLLSLSILHAQALQGLKRIAQAMMVLSVFTPFFVLFGLLAISAPKAVDGARIYLISCGFTLLLGYIWWRRAAPYATPQTKFEASTLLRSCMPLWAVMAFSQAVQWSSQLMLGIWGSPSDVALFASAMRTAMLTSFVLVAVNSIAAPKFAAMHRQGDMAGLRRSAILSVRMMLVAAVPALLFMLLMPEWLMGLFGAEFELAAPALMILALGQFVNIATGSVGYLLSMSGHERLLRFNAFIGASLAVGLGVALIPPYGLIGAAISTSFAIAAQNLLCAYQVRRVLGFNTLAFWGKV